VGSGVSRGVGFDVFSPSLANFAFGIVVAASSGVGDARCFFVDLLVALFAPGLGDFFGLGEGVACVSLRVASSRELLCSSLTCAQRRPATIAPTASAAQMRKRTTATETNRARDAIKRRKFEARIKSEQLNLERETYAARTAGADTTGAALRILSRSRRRMAFHFPPNNRNRQVRYIQVSSTTMDASAR
jgi:hypothetical protein